MSNGLEYRSQQQAWIPGQIRDAAAALITAAFCELAAGRDYFGPDNIPESVTFDGRGSVGSATRMLIDAHIITATRVNLPDSGIHYGRRKSKRAAANGRRVDLYTLCSRGIAEAWMRRNGLVVAEAQGELKLLQ